MKNIFSTLASQMNLKRLMPHEATNIRTATNPENFSTIFTVFIDGNKYALSSHISEWAWTKRTPQSNHLETLVHIRSMTQ